VLVAVAVVLIPLPRSSLRPLPLPLSIAPPASRLCDSVPPLLPLPRSSLRPLRGSAIHSSAASPLDLGFRVVFTNNNAS
jgi:hypothetical protein